MAWFRLWPVAKWPTGKLRHRVGFGKRLVLQIEIEKTYEGGESRLIWRDARVEDMSYTEVRRVSKPMGRRARLRSRSIERARAPPTTPPCFPMRAPRCVGVASARPCFFKC